MQYIFKTFKTKEFQICIKKKYIINNNIKKSQKVEFFFFISSQQIRLAKQFVNYFLIIINIIFNINKNNLFFSVFVYITNILKIISIIYCFIKFEFINTFLFINDCIKNLFFYNNYKRFIIFLDNFIAKLTIIMIKKRTNLFTISKNQINTII